jgi:hypothetical protein
MGWEGPPVEVPAGLSEQAVGDATVPNRQLDHKATSTCTVPQLRT